MNEENWALPIAYGSPRKTLEPSCLFFAMTLVHLDALRHDVEAIQLRLGRKGLHIPTLSKQHCAIRPTNMKFAQLHAEHIRSSDEYSIKYKLHFLQLTAMQTCKLEYNSLLRIMVFLIDPTHARCLSQSHMQERLLAISAVDQRHLHPLTEVEEYTWQRPPYYTSLQKNNSEGSQTPYTLSALKGHSKSQFCHGPNHSTKWYSKSSAKLYKN